MDIFVSLSTVDDSLYFMCNIDDFKFLAEMIQHVPLALRARYVFCCAPINRKMPFVCAMFLKYARHFSRNEPITFDFVVSNCGWPFRLPNTILELVQLETVFDVMDLYLWLRCVDHERVFFSLAVNLRLINIAVIVSRICFRMQFSLEKHRGISTN